MHKCVHLLLQNTNPSEFDCEQLCSLVTTIGAKLDSTTQENLRVKKIKIPLTK